MTTTQKSPNKKEHSVKYRLTYDFSCKCGCGTVFLSETATFGIADDEKFAERSAVAMAKGIIDFFQQSDGNLQYKIRKLERIDQEEKTTQIELV